MMGRETGREWGISTRGASSVWKTNGTNPSAWLTASVCRAAGELTWMEGVSTAAKGVSASL